VIAAGQGTASLVPGLAGVMVGQQLGWLAGVAPECHRLRLTSLAPHSDRSRHRALLVRCRDAPSDPSQDVVSSRHRLDAYPYQSVGRCTETALGWSPGAIGAWADSELAGPGRAALPAASASGAPDFDLVLSVQELALLGQRRGQRSTLFYLCLPYW
jgi:hypothetical protein